MFNGFARPFLSAWQAKQRNTLSSKSMIAGEAVNARHRHHVAGREPVEHPVKLAPVGARARHLLAEDVAAGASGLAKLLRWLSRVCP